MISSNAYIPSPSTPTQPIRFSNEIREIPLSKEQSDAKGISVQGMKALFAALGGVATLLFAMNAEMARGELQNANDQKGAEWMATNVVLWSVISSAFWGATAHFSERAQPTKQPTGTNSETAPLIQHTAVAIEKYTGPVDNSNLV